MIFTVTIEIPDAQVEQMRERAKKHEVANVEQKIQEFVEDDVQEMYAACAGDSYFSYPDIFEQYVAELKYYEQI